MNAVVLLVLELDDHGLIIYVAHYLARQGQALALILIGLRPGRRPGQQIPFLAPFNQLVFTLKILDSQRLHYERIAHAYYAPLY